MMLIAYHGLQAEKDKILAQLQAHYDADEIVHGVYWERGKGCAVGCTVHSDDHASYEPQFGIPKELAWLEDTIFEGLPLDVAKEWPLRFMGAIRVGADLSCVKWQFLYWLLTDPRANPGMTHLLVKDAIADVVALCLRATNGDMASSKEWNAARSAAWNAASAAARSAAHDAAWNAAWNAAADAAWVATDAAWAAAHAAAIVAENSSESSVQSACNAAYERMADNLVALLEVT